MIYHYHYWSLYVASHCIVIMQCVRKVAVHLYNVLEVMSTSVYTGLNLFNFIRKPFLLIWL